MDLEYKTRTGRLIAKRCIKLLRENKKFIIFPLISFISSAAIILTFILPLVLSGSKLIHALDEMNFQTYCYLFLFYFLTSTITIFFNVALIAAMNLKIKGENPELKDGIRIAMSHYKSIIIYVFISSFITVFLRILFEKLQLFGKITSVIAGTIFTWFSYLAIPAMVVEDKDVFSSIKSSADAMKKTWGDRLYRSITIVDGISMLIFLFFVFSAMFIKFYADNNNKPAALIILTIGGLAMVFISFIISVFDSIYKLVLYRYAAEGKVSLQFEEAQLKNAFTTRSVK